MKKNYVEKINIDEIAKEFTREEFLQEAVKEGLGKFKALDDCPSQYKLKCFEFPKCEPERKTQCKLCWMIAIRNIKFKGD